MVYILLAVIYIVQQIFDINHQNLGVTSLTFYHYVSWVGLIPYPQDLGQHWVPTYLPVDQLDIFKINLENV